ncbi:MAG: ABC transporter substrate-binding protein [Acetobacteraceae bacterium]|nr:ABC transporter substrate-binding protein [Acetobacteraceae bacterium]
MKRRALLHRATLAVPAAALPVRRPHGARTRRVVVVGSALTEIAFALGAGGQVVAVDSTSRFPGAAQHLVQIGYMRALPPEGIVSLHPDLLLLSSEAGPPDALAVLRAARQRMVVVEDRAGPACVVAKIEAVAKALQCDGRELAACFAADAAALDPAIAGAGRPRVLFVLSLSRGAPMVSGRATHAASMLQWAGAANAIDAFEGFRPLSAEAALAAAPDLVVMMQHALAEAGGPEALFETPQLRFTPAAAARRVIGIDGAYAFGWGPRSAHARRDLAAAFGAQGLPVLPARPWV